MQPVTDNLDVQPQAKRLNIYDKRDQEFNTVYENKIKEMRNNERSHSSPRGTPNLTSDPVSG